MASDIKVIIETILKDKDFQNKIKGMKTGIDQTARSGNKLTSIIKTGFGAIAGVFAISKLVNVIKSGIKTYADFEQAIANVMSVSNGTREELEALARTAGQTTVFTAKEAADALYFLASAGLEVEQMGEVLTPTLNLAAAAQIGIAEATDIVVNNLKVFAQQGLQAEEATDILAKTVQSSNTNMQQLAEGLKVAGSTAALVGIDFEDLNAMLATMANQGVKGSEAGVKLRQAFARLQKPTGEAAATLEKYGISLDEINKLLPTPIKLFQRLNKANLSNADALAIFGVRQQAVFNVIKNGIPDLVKMREEIDNAGGSAKRAADIQINTLQGAFKLLGSQMSELVITLVDKVAPGLKLFVEGAAEMIKKINQIGKEQKEEIKISKEVEATMARMAGKYQVLTKESKKRIAANMEQMKILNKLLELSKRMNDLTQEEIQFVQQAGAEFKSINEIRKKVIELEKENNKLIREGTIENKNRIDAAKTRAEKEKAIEEERQKKLMELQEQLDEYYMTKDEERELEIYEREENIKAILDESLENKIISEEFYNEQIRLLYEDTAIKINELQEQITKKQMEENRKRLKNATTALSNMQTQWNNYSSAVKSINDIMTKHIQDNLAAEEKGEKESKKRKKERLRAIAIANKTLAHIQVAIDTATAIVKTYANLGYPAGIAAAIAVGVQGAAQQAVIASKGIPELARGTSGFPDNTLAKINRNEMVLPAELSNFVRDAAANQTTNNNITNNENINLGGMNVDRNMTIGEIIDQYEELAENTNSRVFSRMS